MTTKPKARRFRIRRVGGGDDGAQGTSPEAQASARDKLKAALDKQTGDDDKQPLAKRDDGFGKEAFPTARRGKPKGAAAPDPTPTPVSVKAGQTKPEQTATEVIEAEIGAIRKEGLTARQLRMARRLAHKHELKPKSDFDAVRLLRKAGIDPFQRANMLELVVAEPDKGDGSAQAKPTGTAIMDPAMAGAAGTGTAVSTEVMDAASRRSREIHDIQRDIARRRRMRIMALFMRLAIFVLLPTIVAGWYFYMVATPMYATKSEFVIQQADGQAASGLGGLFSGTGLATSQDSITVQSYLGSREAMLRLTEDLGFKEHFSDPSIDALQRLDSDATNEAAYRLFKKHVKIGYDPTEGIIRMEVSAASPESSAEFSRALIGYAEEQVDQLTRRLREDQMRGANAVFADAEENMATAQQTVLELQERLGVLDPASETSSVMSQISTFETQLAEKRLQLQQLLDNAAPNRARVSGTEGDISRLETLIASLRSQLTESSSGEGSLAQVTGRLRMAEVDLETRTLMMQEALQSRETARTEADRQVRYLSLGVNPVPPDEPTYPRAFENTLLALLIFAGIYLMISLTASILREQVSG